MKEVGKEMGKWKVGVEKQRGENVGHMRVLLG